MKLKLFFTFLCFLALTSDCLCQQNYFKITKKSQGEYLNFPVINNTDSNIVAEKINAYLQISKLNLIVKSQKEIFNKIIPGNFDVNGITAMYYQIHSNNKRFLSLSFNESGTFAGTHHWNENYNFNSKNGNLIHLQDIFTSKGFLNFKALSLKRRVAKFNKEFNQLGQVEKMEYEQPTNSFINSDNLKDYYLKDSFIYINDYNLQSKNQKVLIFNLLTSYKLKEIKPFLNNYGKALFGLANDSFLNFQTNTYPQLYKGFVRDSFPIVMLLEKHNDTEINGYYVYTKYGIGIELSGSLIGNKLSLTEKNSTN